VVAIAAATFVLSYAGVHAIALQSGVPASLARLYPAVFDAVLVVACAAVPLRTRWLTRSYTWLVIIVVVGLVGAMDAVHAMNVAIPRRQAAGVAAVLPWALLLLAFSLWLAIVRHFRGQHGAADAPAGADRGGPPALTAGAAAVEPVRVEHAMAERVTVEPAAGPGAGGRLEEPDADEPGDLEEPAADEAGDVAGELLGGGRGDDDTADAGTGDPDSVPGEEAAQAPVPEVPGVPYATGPRLHRVRSLPAPPVDDDGDEG